MNLHELEITKDVRQPEVNWKTVFEKHGWKVLGQGIEATVGRKPGSPYVLKVYPQTSAYNSFLKFCAQHPSEHLPKFSRSARNIPGTNPPMMYVRMEPLVDLTQNMLFAMYMPEIAYAWLEAEKQGLELNWGFHRLVLERLVKAFKIDVQNLLVDPETQKTLWREVGEPGEDWKRVVPALIAWMRKFPKHELDLHSGNFMVRGRTLVIVDPFYEGKY